MFLDLLCEMPTLAPRSPMPTRGTLKGSSGLIQGHTAGSQSLTDGVQRVTAGWAHGQAEVGRGGGSLCRPSGATAALPHSSHGARHQRHNPLAAQLPEGDRPQDCYPPPNSAPVPSPEAWTRRPSLGTSCPSMSPPPSPSHPQQERTPPRAPGSSQHHSLGLLSLSHSLMPLRTSAAPTGRCSSGSVPGLQSHTPVPPLHKMSGPEGAEGTAASYPPAQCPGSSPKSHKEQQTAHRVRSPQPSQGQV